MSPIDYLQAQNTPYFLIITLLVLLFSFPLGLAVVNLFFKSLEARVKFFLSFPFGLISLVGFWSILIFVKTPITPVILISAYVILTIFLFAILKKKHISVLDSLRFEIKRSDFILPLVLFLFCYFCFTSFYIDNWVPPHQDAQLHGFIEMFMKTEASYPVIHPYGGQAALKILYPPGYHVIIVVLAQVTDIPIQIISMIVSTLSLSLMSLVLYQVAYYLTANRYIALFAGVLTVNRASFFIMNTSQMTEMLALLACTVFLFSFCYILRDNKSAVIPGIYMGIIGLIHSRFFLWLGVTLFVFAFLLLIAKDKKFRADIKSIIILVITAFLVLSPWLIGKINIIDPSSGTLHSHRYAYIHDIAEYWGWGILPFTVIGGAIIWLRKRKCEFFILAWVISCFFLIRYWSILALFNPTWFESKEGYYLDPFSFTTPDTIPFYALNFAIPLMSAYSFKLLLDPLQTEKQVGSINIKFLRKEAIAKFLTKHLQTITLLLIASFVYIELHCPRTKELHGQQITGVDVKALTWLKEHTTFEDTLVLNPNTPANWGYWAPVISERKTVFFRNTDHRYIGKRPDLGIDWQEADWAFHHINEPKAKDILKKYQITHIYIPGQFNIRKNKDIYKIYEKCEESSYLRKVFSSLQNSSPAYIFKAEIYEVIK